MTNETSWLRDPKVAFGGWGVAVISWLGLAANLQVNRSHGSVDAVQPADLAESEQHDGGGNPTGDERQQREPIEEGVVSTVPATTRPVPSEDLLRRARLAGKWVRRGSDYVWAGHGVALSEDTGEGVWSATADRAEWTGR